MTTNIKTLIDGNDEYIAPRTLVSAISDGTDTLPTILDGKADTEDIPTKTSDLTNDSDFVTKSVNNLENYRTSSAQDTIDVGKVDKVTGKGLSTEDYTTAEKTKLSGIETGAQVNIIDEDAPSDGKMYVRKDGEWSKLFDSVSTWEDIQLVARAGVAKDVLELGQVFTFKRDNVEIPAMIVDFITANEKGSIKIKNSNLDNGVIFHTVDNLYNLQFDSAEAFYYAESALAAGTYNFTIGSTYSSWVAGTYQFTLANELPAGGQLTLSGNAGTALTSLKVNAYASRTTTTATEQCTITSGNDGTALGTLDGTTLNHTQRVSYGNSRWLYSAIRQHLNSNAAAGSVWTPQHKWDRPPSWVSVTKGFMNGLETSFTNYVAEVEVDTYRNTVTDGGGLDTTDEKFFLAGRNEMWFPQEGSDNGVVFEYYKQESISSVAHNAADPIRIKKTGNSAYYWWLRSPNVGTACNVRLVAPDGSSSDYCARDALGVAPAFVIA